MGERKRKRKTNWRISLSLHGGNKLFDRTINVSSNSINQVSCVQAWYYFTHQRDAWPLKLLVSSTTPSLHIYRHSRLKPVITKGYCRHDIRHDSSNTDLSHPYVCFQSRSKNITKRFDKFTRMLSRITTTPHNCKI
jgi:hypothetical protein